MAGRWSAFLRPIIATASFVPLALVGQHLFLDLSPIYGRSMQPTLNPVTDTDIVLVKKGFMSASSSLRSGDIVVLRSPFDPSEWYIKRITALPGEKVQFEGAVLTIPDHHCWIEGDNPQFSFDSNAFGPISQSLIHGKVSGVVWPPHRLQFLDSKVHPWQRTAVVKDTLEAVVSASPSSASLPSSVSSPSLPSSSPSILPPSSLPASFSSPSLPSSISSPSHPPLATSPASPYILLPTSSASASIDPHSHPSSSEPTKTTTPLAVSSPSA